MEFSQKMQELRKQKNMTQEDLAEALYVSRTAISKWESGRGYPSIDSLKAIAEYFSISVDELLSGNELINAAQAENRIRQQNMRDLVFGLLDCAVAAFLFLPFFGQEMDGGISIVPLLSLKDEYVYILTPYYVLVILTILWGIATLALQNYHGAFWTKVKTPVSLILSVLAASFFMLTRQPYPAFFTFMYLMIKGILLIKRQ